MLSVSEREQLGVWEVNQHSDLTRVIRWLSVSIVLFVSLLVFFFKHSRDISKPLQKLVLQHATLTNKWYVILLEEKNQATLSYWIAVAQKISALADTTVESLHEPAI